MNAAGKLHILDARDASGFRQAGVLSWRDFAELASGVRRWLDAQAVRGPLRRKVFSTFVEMTYNVLSHSTPLSPDPDATRTDRSVEATIALGTTGTELWVATENLVDQERANVLSERLRQLATLGPTEQRDLYRGRLLARDRTAAAIPPGNNAGLGLITIARDVKRPLEFSLVPVRTGELFIFSLKATV
jgi:Family of unknown function (DUF6272)